MKSKTILVLPIDGPPRTLEAPPGPTLDMLQRLVGGWIETIPSPFFPAGCPLRRLTVFGDEEARLRNPPKVRSPWTLVVDDPLRGRMDVLGDLVVELPRPDHPAIQWAHDEYKRRNK